MRLSHIPRANVTFQSQYALEEHLDHIITSNYKNALFL